MTTAHITTPPLHPLVDAWTDAGTLVDATYETLYGGTNYGKDYPSFNDRFAACLDEVDAYSIVSLTSDWAHAVEQSCRVAATKQLVMNAVNLVCRVADRAAKAMLESTQAETDLSHLYRVYLDNFIEYLTPSLKQGRVVDGHVVDPHGVRCRVGTYTDVNALRAQAQGVVDAQLTLDGAAGPLCIPRDFDGFCAHLGLARK